MEDKGGAPFYSKVESVLGAVTKAYVRLREVRAEGIRKCGKRSRKLCQMSTGCCPKTVGQAPNLINVIVQSVRHVKAVVTPFRA